MDKLKNCHSSRPDDSPPAIKPTNREIIDALAGSSDEMIEIRYQYNLSRLTLARAKGDVRLLLSD